MPVKVDTQQARQVIAQMCFFRDDLHQKRHDFLQELQEYYESISEEHFKTRHLLEEANRGLAAARAYEAACEAALAAADEEDEAQAQADLDAAIAIRQLWEQKVALLKQALEIYTEQIKRIESQILEEAYQQSKNLLLDYNEEHNRLCRRSAQAIHIIEKQYNRPPPSLPSALYAFFAHLEALQKRLDPKLKTAKIQEANAKYQEFLEERKQEFITSPDNTLQVGFSELNLPLFPAVFSTTIGLDHLSEEKPMVVFRALKALQKALEERSSLQELFNEEEQLQINKGITPKGYLWHFDGNPPLGTMQLVREEILLKVPHTKGYPLWQQIATQLNT
ncbi:HNH endonuclease signature motif containing protein [Helicobacter labacensis]|uniref:HNH endonuclease signature motif containing protein n=1 Tax=Helicobacter labacensis TaxID=2316079 RepID=UPI000EB2F69D|nr:HNH endonuclease [Helicobacter labacensis]